MSVIEETDGDPLPNKKYMNAYCRATVHAMHGDKKKEAENEELAATLPCDPILRKWDRTGTIWRIRTASFT